MLNLTPMPYVCLGGGGICPIRCRSENSNVFLNLFPKLEFDIVSNLQKTVGNPQIQIIQKL